MICALYCLKDLLAIFSFGMILRCVFREQPRPGAFRPVLLAAVSAAGSVAGYLLLTPGSAYAFEILDFINSALALASIPFLFRRPRFWRSFAVLFLYYATVDTLWSFLSTFFHGGIAFELLFNLLLSAAVSAAAYIGANHKDLNVIAGAFHEIPVWLLVSLFLFELTNYYKEFGASKTWYNALYVISSCLVFLSILYLAFRVFRLVYTQNDILQKLNSQLLTESRRIDSDETLRRFRHDWKNHTAVINAMLEQGELENAKRYFGSLSESLSDAVSSFSTGNTVADALLNGLVRREEAQDIRILFEGAIPETGIEPKDMCICFGNLLDNAAEACAALPEGADKRIRIQSIIQNNILILTFENPIAAVKKIASGALPKTTKKDKKAHGIGLRNVEDVAKKYNGTLLLTADRERFTAELMLETDRPV